MYITYTAKNNNTPENQIKTDYFSEMIENRNFSEYKKVEMGKWKACERFAGTIANKEKTAETRIKKSGEEFNDFDCYNNCKRKHVQINVEKKIFQVEYKIPTAALPSNRKSTLMVSVEMKVEKNTGRIFQPI